MVNKKLKSKSNIFAEYRQGKNITIPVFLILTSRKQTSAGNIIDLGVNKSFNIIKDVKKILTQDFWLILFLECYK